VLVFLQPVSVWGQELTDSTLIFDWKIISYQDQQGEAVHKIGLEDN